MKRWMGISAFALVICLLVGISIVHGQGTPHSNKVTWTLSTTSGVTSQKVYRGTVSGGPYTLLATIPDGTTTQYLDTNTTQGITHFYVLTALVGTNESIFTSQVSGGPDAGTNVNPQSGLAVTNQ